MGGGKGTRRQTEFYKNEQEPARGVKMVKARFDSNRKPYNILDKEYKDIQEILENNNVGDEDACKKMTEIEDMLNIIDETSVQFFN